MQVATGFWASKVLLEAIEVDLFTVLASDNSGAGLTAAEVASKVGWAACQAKRPLAICDFLNSLVALGFLVREDNDGDEAKHEYKNGADVGAFLNRNGPTFIGGYLSILNKRQYGLWGNLGEALKSGLPQNELRGAPPGADLWQGEHPGMYRSPEQTEGFLKAMAALQMGNFMLMCGGNAFDDVFGRAKVVCDCGGADATLACMIAEKWGATLDKVISLDLAPTAPFAREVIDERGVAGKVHAVVGSFYDPLPEKADVIILGNILHSFGVETKMRILSNCLSALNEGGCLIAIELVADDAKRANVPALLMSLNMLIQTAGGANFSMKEFEAWTKKAGFSGKCELRALTPGAGALLAFK